MDWSLNYSTALRIVSGLKIQDSMLYYYVNMIDWNLSSKEKSEIVKPLFHNVLHALCNTTVLCLSNVLHKSCNTLNKYKTDVKSDPYNNHKGIKQIGKKSKSKT